jgi:hypothetical protein
VTSQYGSRSPYCPEVPPSEKELRTKATRSVGDESIASERICLTAATTLKMTCFSQLDMTTVPTGSTFFFESSPHNPPIDFYDETLKCSGCYEIIFPKSSHLVEQLVLVEKTHTAYFHLSHNKTVCVWTGYASSYETGSSLLPEHRKRSGDHVIESQASKRFHV